MGENVVVIFCRRVAGKAFFVQVPFMAKLRKQNVDFGLFWVRLTDFSMRCAGVFRLAEWDSEAVCTAAILSRPCPLWVKSGHRGTFEPCLLYPQKRTWWLSWRLSFLFAGASKPAVNLSLRI